MALLLQANINHFGEMKEAMLRQFLLRGTAHILALQETSGLRVEAPSFLDWGLRREDNPNAGGVTTMAIKGHQVPPPEELDKIPGIEILITKHESATIANIYWPPRRPGDKDAKMLIYPLLHVLHKHRVDIICGDFNASHASWSNKVSPTSKVRGAAIHWAASMLGWRIHSARETRDVSIDLVLSRRNTTLVPILRDTFTFPKVDHPILLWEIQGEPIPLFRPRHHQTNRAHWTENTISRIQEVESRGIMHARAGCVPDERKKNARKTIRR